MAISVRRAVKTAPLFQRALDVAQKPKEKPIVAHVGAPLSVRCKTQQGKTSTDSNMNPQVQLDILKQKRDHRRSQLLQICGEIAHLYTSEPSSIRTDALNKRLYHISMLVKSLNQIETEINQAKL